MGFNLRNRSFTKLLDFTPREIQFLLKLAADLKAAKYGGYEQQRMRGKNIAVIFEKTSTRTRVAFEVAAYDQGAHVTYLGPSGTQIGHKESMKDTARVLGRIYDGIEYRGYGQEIVEELAKYAGVPVWNGLTDEFHPTQILADVLTMTEFSRQAAARTSPSATSATPATTWATRCSSAGASSAWTSGSVAPKCALAGRTTSSPTCREIASTDRRADHPHRGPGRGGRGRRLPVHRRLGLDGRGLVGLGRAGQAPQARTRSTRTSSRRPAIRR